MDKAQLQAEAPGLYDEIKADGRAEGVTAERDRISQINASALPGHEALIAKCITDGTSVADARGQILAAEKATRQQAGAARAADVQQPLQNAAGAANEDGPTTPQEMAAAAKLHAAEKGIDFLAAYKQLFGPRAA